jgi:hypothetical protein
MARAPAGAACNGSSRWPLPPDLVRRARSGWRRRSERSDGPGSMRTDGTYLDRGVLRSWVWSEPHIVLGRELHPTRSSPGRPHGRQSLGLETAGRHEFETAQHRVRTLHHGTPGCPALLRGVTLPGVRNAE